MTDPRKNYSLWLKQLEVMNMNEQLSELDRIKKLVQNYPPDHFIVYGGIKVIFGNKITALLDAHFPPATSDDFYSNFFIFADSHRGTIFLGDCAVRINAGRFGQMDGIPNETYEVEVYSRRDEYGVIAKGTQACFATNGDSIFHGSSSNPSTWTSCEILRKLKDAGIAEIVKIFCTTLNDENRKK